MDTTSNEYSLKSALLGETEPDKYLIERLVGDSVDLNSVNQYGGSSLLIAAFKNHLNAARILLNAGASVHVRGENFLYKGLTPLDVSSWNKHGTEMVRELIRKGADVNSQTYSKRTPLHFASSGQCVKNIRELLKHGAKVNAVTKLGETPLCYALMSESFQLHTAAILLKNGADVNIRDIRGQSVLHVAVLKRHLLAVCLLLNKNADVNVCDAECCTPLHYAARDTRQPFKIIRQLVKGGANLNALNEKGQSVLHYAVNKYNVKTTRELLRCGATSALVASIEAVERNFDKVNQNHRKDITMIFQDLIRYAFIQNPNSYKNICRHLMEDRVVNFLGEWSTSKCNLKNFADACLTEVDEMSQINCECGKSSVWGCINNDKECNCNTNFAILKLLESGRLSNFKAHFYYKLGHSFRNGI